MFTNISFTHLLNPFPARPGTDHSIAARITWETLRAATKVALERGVSVACRAVILPGDEAAVEPPAASVVYLNRTIQDLLPLKPKRPLPLVEDVLRAGVRDCPSTHVIFTNMDISVQPHFYTTLHDLVSGKIGVNVPFTVARINVDSLLANQPLERLYTAHGSLGHGFDCFVIPRQLIHELDLGTCCIGAPHFDLLLYMELDVLSGHLMMSLSNERLTFHLGSNITWAAMMDYVEHNLSESLAAIERMKHKYVIQPGSAFDRLERRHFRRNARTSSAMLRKIRRIPGLSIIILHLKRAIGREY